MSWRDFAGILDDPEIQKKDIQANTIRVSKCNTIEVEDDEIVADHIQFDIFTSHPPQPQDTVKLDSTSKPRESRFKTNPEPTSETDTSLNTVPTETVTGIPRKRSRWGAETPAVSDVPADLGNVHSAPAEAAPAPARRSRWAAHQETTATPAVSTASSLAAALAKVQEVVSQTGSSSSLSLAHLEPRDQQRFRDLQKQVELLSTKIANPALWYQEDVVKSSRPRSPSPDAIYDATGKRVNTREQRYRDKCSSERNALITEAQALVPSYTVIGHRRERPSMTIVIPVDEYPNYNFSGLIIGPRGNTHRRLEQETGCKISIRGRLMAHENTSKRHTGNNEPAHVYIQGETQALVDKAVALIRKLLTPISEDENEHKARQLRELAALNGFNKDGNGVRAKMLQARENSSYTGVTVRCDHCSSSSHVSQDCPNRNVDFDKDYSDFMQEMTGISTGFGANVKKDGNDGQYGHTHTQPPTQLQQSHGHGHGYAHTYDNSAQSRPPPPPPSALPPAPPAPPAYRPTYAPPPPQNRPPYNQGYQAYPPPPPSNSYEYQYGNYAPPASYYPQQQFYQPPPPPPTSIPAPLDYEYTDNFMALYDQVSADKPTVPPPPPP